MKFGDIFLKTVEEELQDNSLETELKKISKQIDRLKQQEREIIQMKFDGRISDDLYDEQHHAIMKKKEVLTSEKITIETNLKSDVGVKERLGAFRKHLESRQLITEFDRTIFESLVEKVIVGGITDDNEIDPAKITFIYKSGYEMPLNGKDFREKRKNGKDKPRNCCEELCTISENNQKKLSSESTCTKNGGSGEVVQEKEDGIRNEKLVMTSFFLLSGLEKIIILLR